MYDNLPFNTANVKVFMQLHTFFYQSNHSWSWSTMYKLMKKVLLPFLMALMLTSCSTYQYSTRTLGVNRQPVQTTEAAVEVVPDYERVVSASSDYHITQKDAITEAEYLCIVNNKIDVVVDPIMKVECTPLQKKKYRATITGYAGTYKKANAGVDAVGGYSKEEIEKYKLLTDPNFPQYYYNRGTGDTYYINSQAGSPLKASASLAIAPKKGTKALLTNKYDFTSAKKLRNAGIGTTVAGVLATFAIGVPVFVAAESSAGITFLTLGPIATVAGIPMWAIGAKRMKESGANISVASSKNGVGLKLNF